MTPSPTPERRRFFLASSVVFIAACGFYAADEPEPVFTPVPDGGRRDSNALPVGDGGVLEPLPPGPECPGDGLSCIPVAPAGWSGPFVLYDGNPANAPKCPDAMPAIALDGHRDLSTSAPHTCTACDCGGAKNVKCDSVTFTTWATPDCTGANIAPKQVGATCQPTPQTYPSSHAIVGNATGGTCDPKPAVIKDKPDTTFAYTTRACGAELVSDGCTDGFVCAANPLPPFNAKHCIAQNGDVTCPGAPYNVKTTTFAVVDDARACAACTCGAVTGASCTGSIEGFDQAGCGGTKTTVGYPQACKQGLAGYDSLKVLPGTPSGGACTPSGGAPTGEAKLTDLVTICCAQ